jgi:uncharacterized protein YyaL (SSP411 family)
LLQHKHNPVDWWPWSEEAFEEARRRNAPILLSVGYSSCHWCHVMAHESFEDPETASYLNEHFVAIKVDREERPDVDSVYMEATQAMTGQGGWPMTCALTPDGEPFFCGTYFPKDERGGHPSFRRVLEAIATAWQDRRGELEAAGADVVRRLGELNAPAAHAPGAHAQAPDAELLDRATRTALAAEDTQRGGFGGAPKFPPSMTLEALLRHHARTGDAAALAAVERACTAMARGGIYDQLAGGFARYSVDATWTVPHFEKMLYDNAQLARVYLHWWRATGAELGKRIALETCDWMVAELLTPEGGFASSLDADSPAEPGGHPHEGTFYVWTPEQVGPSAAELFAVTEAGTFEAGSSVLQLPRPPTDPAGIARWQDERRRLLQVRATRPRPGRDDKVVTAWNGLAIAALAEVGTLLDRPDLVAAAIECAELLAELHLADGRLRRASRNGAAGDPVAVLEDYGCLADGLLTLHQVTGDPRWLELALQLLDIAVGHFRDGSDGGFFDTADDAPALVRRPKDPTDGATPSGAAATSNALVTAAALTGRLDLRDVAEQALHAVRPLLERAPRFAGQHWTAAEALAAGPLEIAVIEAPTLAAIARLTPSPGAVVVTGGRSPLLADRPPGAAYICRNFTCDAPISDPDMLRSRLDVGSPTG